MPEIIDETGCSCQLFKVVDLVAQMKTLVAGVVVGIGLFQQQGPYLNRVSILPRSNTQENRHNPTLTDLVL
jgi:hypothetical protein